MKRYIGVTARGIRGPIIKQGDDLAKIVVDSLLLATESEGIALHDKDVIAITESVVARSQGNYASTEDLAQSVLGLGPKGLKEIVVVNPIFSRNLVSQRLEGIAKTKVEKITVIFNLPYDEVGNHLISDEDYFDFQCNLTPGCNLMTLAEFRKYFPEGKTTHQFTGVDYLEYYKEIIEKQGPKANILIAPMANPMRTAIVYTQENKLAKDETLYRCADIHTRNISKKTLLKYLGEDIAVICLTDIMKAPVGNSGYNPKYGVLGTNISRDGEVKLFPREDQKLLADIAEAMYQKTGKHLEVMVYGDGAFKDPVGHIWELADPVVSPFHTPGLDGTPNELKLKYLADNDFDELKGEAAAEAIRQRIVHKDANLVGKMESQGTTPRQITDLLGSLCDLTSGSGDKGTPFILIQGYFDNFATE